MWRVWSRVLRKAGRDTSGAELCRRERYYMPRAEVARQVRALHRVYATVGRVVYADAKRKREFSAIHHFDATNPDACACSHAAESHGA
jgi:hypothetical protein